MQFHINTQMSPLVAAGTVRSVEKFGERGVQDTNDAGQPLWEIDVLVPGMSFGKPTTDIVAVRVPSPTEPKVAQYQPVNFERPEVSFYASKGVLRTNLSAAGIAASK
jgi:hypothetical protein